MSEDLSANYAGAFSNHLEPGNKSALLIVDVIMAYLDPDSPLYAKAESALRANERLRNVAESANVPIIFTNLIYHEEGFDGGYFLCKVPALNVCREGSPMGAFPPTLQPSSHNLVISKQYPSAFFGTSLASTLRYMGVDTLLITGFSTSGCVRATTVDAMQHGFIPMVVRDACADRHSAPHEANLFDLQAKYAEVISESAACDLLARKGKTS